MSVKDLERSPVSLTASLEPFLTVRLKMRSSQSKFGKNQSQVIKKSVLTSAPESGSQVCIPSDPLEPVRPERQSCADARNE